MTPTFSIVLEFILTSLKFLSHKQTSLFSTKNIVNFPLFFLERGRISQLHLMEIL
jgi:hypothetical protein